MMRYMLLSLFIIMIFHPSNPGCEDVYKDNTVQFIELAKRISQMSYPNRKINFYGDTLEQGVTGWVSINGRTRHVPNLYFVEMAGGYRVWFEFKETTDHKNKFRKYEISRIYHQNGTFRYDFRSRKWCNSDGECRDADLLNRTYDTPLVVDIDRLRNTRVASEKAPSRKIEIDQLENHVGQPFRIAMKNGNIYEKAIIREIKANTISIQREIYGGTVKFAISKDEIAQITALSVADMQKPVSNLYY